MGLDDAASRATADVADVSVSEKLERHQLEELLNRAPAGIGLMIGPDHRWTYVNNRYVRLTGRRSAAELLGKTLRESLPELEPQSFFELLDEVYRSGERYAGNEVKVRLNRASSGQSDEGYYDFVYEPVRNAEGQVDGILVHAFEVTDRVMARRAADEARQKLAAIVESSDDAIVSKDLNGVVTSWNPCAERIFGFTAEEMIGQPITKIIPEALQDDETRILSTIARGERIDHFETVRRTKNGEEIEVSLTVSPVKDETGRIVGAAKIARDITQRRKAERALRVSERLASVGRLAATVAHEINNPLEAVTNLIYLARNTSNPDEIRKYLASAEEELYRIAHLTRQTLGFYRESNSAASIQVGPLIISLVAVFSSRARGHRIELSPEIREDAERCRVPAEIRQVVANLVSNSIDALGGGGQVRIRVSAATQQVDGRQRGVRITVADPGSGIPAEVRKKLFEPFFTTKKDIGTGLGLWICKSIVENHKGTIRVRSETTPGRSWTVFSVFVPVDGELQAGTPKAEQAIRAETREEREALAKWAV